MNAPKINEPARDAIRAAIAGMLKREPFFAHVAYGMKFHEAKEGSVATNELEGTAMVYNPDWINSMNQDQVMGVVAQSMLKVAYLHPFRRASRDAKKWDVATAMAANHVLHKHGFTVPEGTPLNLDFSNNRSTEQIYDLLEQQGNRGPGTSSPKSGNISADPEGQSKAKPGQDPGDQDGDGEGQSQADQEREARKATARAAARAREAGKMPGDLESIITHINTPQRDWKDVLRRILGGGDIPDPSWSRPNRRYIAEGDYLPGNARHGPGKIVIAIDTSGSIDDSLLAKFMGEIKGIAHDLQPEKTHVCCCDTRIQWEGEFGPYEDVTARAVGRGGTDFRPIFDWVEERGIRPKALVLFTDTYGPYPTNGPGYPVINVVWPGGGENIPAWSEMLKMA